MGREIETIALERNHTIVQKFSEEHPFSKNQTLEADVAIEFTAPKLAVAHIEQCLSMNTPVIVGTTGWTEALPHIKKETERHNGSILYASNFSLGVHLFFEMSKKLSALMNGQHYMPTITETHHTEKLDQPSGTAITTAEGMLSQLDHYKTWKLNDGSSELEASELPVVSKRTENVPGTHEVSFSSDIDQISLTHTANNRKGFALGAVIAAEWILDKKGIFTMEDILNLK